MTRSSGRDATADPAPVPEWRLLITEPAGGAWNMAVDEAMLYARAEGSVPPTLRLYRWNPPTISLGRFQELDERIDRAAIRERGYGLVRRPTGGRAILHADELTYSVAIREADIRHGATLMGSYRELSRGIEAALLSLGIGSSLGAESQREAGGGKALPTICFAKAARCDLVSAGRKVVGSAQTRTRGCVLQHGSVPITIDFDELLAVLPGSPGEPLGRRRQKLEGAAVGVSDLLGRPVSFDELAAAMREGFEAALGVTFQDGSLTAREQTVAEGLVGKKYGAAEWTEKAPSKGSQ